jgi:WD40 repeat protein
VNSQIHGLRLTSDQTGIIAISEVTAKIFDFKTGKIVTAFDLPNAYPIWNNNDQTIFADDSIVGDDSLIARFSGPSCEIDELRLFSLKDPKDFVTVDKPDKCKKPKEGDSFGDAKIFTSPAGPGIVITRYGLPEVKQWDPKTRSVTRTIQWSDGGDDIIGLDSGFKLAVSRRAENIRISQLTDGALVREFKGTAYPAETSFVSRDDHIMLLSHAPAAADRNDKDATVWPLGTLTPASTHFAADKETYIRDFAPAAKLALAVTEKGDMIVLSAETGKELRRFSVPYIESFARARLSPDGKLIAVVGTDANDKAVAALLDAGSGAVIHRFAGHDERNGMMASSGSGDESDLVSTVTFSSDSKRLALGRWNGTAEIWDIQKVQRVKTLPAAEGDDADQIWSLAFSADGSKLIAGSRDGGAFLWDIASARAPRTFVYESLAGHVHIASVALSHDGALVAGGLALHAVSSGDIGTEHSIKVWNAATGKLRFTLRGHEGGVEAVVFSPDNRWIISTGNDGTVRYWNSSNGQWAATFTATRDGRWIIFTESGIFAGTADGDDFIDVVRGVESLPASKFRDQLFRPELVEALLNGDRDHRYQDAARKLDLEKVWGANMAR